MNSRLIITLLCAGALAIACTARARSDSASALATAGAPSAALRHDTTTSPAKLKASLNVNPQGTNVHLSLHVVNTTKKKLEVNFANGQSYDFVVVDSLGREVWRWGKGRMFTQSLRNKFVDGGDSFEVDERWDNPPAPGRYTAIATLTSTNYPVSERVDFRLR